MDQTINAHYAWEFEDDPERLRSAARYVDREIQRISAEGEEPNPWDALHNHRAMGPWQHVGHTSEEGVTSEDALREQERPWAEAANKHAAAFYTPSYSTPIADETPKFEEFDDSGIVEYVNRLAKAVMVWEDERINELVAKAWRERPMKDIRIVQRAGDAQSRAVEIRDGDEWREFRG